MEYQYVLKDNKKSEFWPAQIRLISRDQNSIEAEIRGRGSCFYVIVGKGIYGNYLCILDSRDSTLGYH